MSAHQDIARMPLRLVIQYNEKVISVDVPTREKVVQALTKFSMQLPDAGERGVVLMWLGELSDPLSHYSCLTGENWRVSISGALAGEA